MIIIIKGKAIRVVLRRGEKRDFDKERKERQVWRHPYPDPLQDLP